MHDLIIRGGTIHDGSGEPGFTGDVAIRDGRIVEVGRVEGTARREIDADGLLVTPGFVDIHTHYDGQVTWDPHLLPSGAHGVTTAVFGNCGVGFAPVAPGKERYLIELMEGVEDIPGTALAEGIEWEWESFPEFLDALDRRRLALDVGTQVPHGAVRAYAMGERGARNQPANADDIAQMARLVREGMEAGALGFSTSRTIVHRAIDGEPVPGTFAAEDELFGIGRAMGRGVFELAPAGAAGEDVLAPRKEIEWMCRLSAETGRPVTFAMIQVDGDPTLWRDLLERSREAVADGAQVFPQVAGRPSGLLMGLQTAMHPFSVRPSYRAIADLPLAERVQRMQDPELRRRIVSEQVELSAPMQQYIATSFHKLFPMGDPPNYEPRREDSVAGIAAREGRTPDDVLYDLMLRQGGKELLLFHLFNFSDFNCDHMIEMFRHPRAAFGLGDGGAHCGVICDASIPTFMFTHWTRDRKGEQLPVEFVVRRMTHDTSQLYGLHDRGLLRPGYLGDVNVIDYENLRLHRPEMAHDLPGGARRLMQHADGYRYTIKRGEITLQDGEITDARPGGLIRGAQEAPAS